MPIDPVQLTYDSYNLQNDTVITADIDGDEAAPPKAVGVYEMPVLHGAKKTFEKVQARRISIAGVIKSPTISGLIGKLEEVKELFTRQDKQLLITYPNSYPRLYTATVEGNLEVQREPWSLNLARFKATFLCIEPWSVQTATSISGVYNISAVSQALSIGISGTLDPQPQIYFNTTASGSRFSLTNQTTGDTIDVPTTFSGTGRSLMIDCYNQVVSVDGQQVTFKGTFPRFNPGVNSLLVQTYGTAGAVIDQSYEDTTATNVSPFGNTVQVAQSFVPTRTTLTAIELYIARYNSGGTYGDITVTINSNSAGVPSSSILGTATISASNVSSQTKSWKRASFSTAITLTPGTTYWIVISSSTSTTSYNYLLAGSFTSGTNTAYSSGTCANSANSGSSWTAQASIDLLFRAMVDGGTPLTGKMIVQYNPRRW